MIPVSITAAVLAANPEERLMSVLFDVARRRPAPTRRGARRTAPAPVPVLDLLRLVRAVADSPYAWKPRLQLPHGADRWWTQLYADRRFDLWLLSWLPGHSTD